MKFITALFILIALRLVASAQTAAEPTLAERFEIGRQQALVMLRAHSLKHKHKDCVFLKLIASIEAAAINFGPTSGCGTSYMATPEDPYTRYIFNPRCEWTPRFIAIAILHEAGHTTPGPNNGLLFGWDADSLSDLYRDAHAAGRYDGWIQKTPRDLNKLLGEHFESELSGISDKIEKRKPTLAKAIPPIGNGSFKVAMPAQLSNHLNFQLVIAKQEGK
jgi:hypothetical protein